MDQRSHPRRLAVVAVVTAVALIGLILLAAFTPTNRVVAVATGILVIVTSWYAWQTRQMVSQMESARAAQVRPHLALSLDLEQGGAVFLRVVNAGVGPAMSVDVRIESEPGPGVRIPYITPVLAPGAGQSFIVRDGASQAVVDLKQLVHTLQANG
jgi:hypothetical protein